MSCSPETLRLFHASDLHFGAEDTAPLLAFRNAVALEKPDLVILTGDITHSARRVEIQSAFEYLSQFEAPVCLVPGNHDTPVYSPLLRLFDPFGRFRRLADPNTGLFPSVQAPRALWSNLHLARLRTAHGIQFRTDWSLGCVIAREQRDFSLSMADSQARWKIVACHHPLIDPPQSRVKGRTWGGAMAHNVFAAAGAHMILCGHAHQAFAGHLGTDPEGPVTLVAPTLSNNRTRGGQQGYLDIRLSDQGIIADLCLFTPQLIETVWNRKRIWPNRETGFIPEDQKPDQ